MLRRVSDNILDAQERGSFPGSWDPGREPSWFARISLSLPGLRCMRACMDFLAQQFISASKRLHAELVALRKSIDTIRDQKERQHQEHETHHPAEQPPYIGIRGEVNAEVHETKTAERENRSRHNKNLWVQVVLAFGTLGAFVATALYASIAARELRQARNAFEMDEKATIVVKDVGWRVVSQTAAGGQVVTRRTFQQICDDDNTGRRICLDINFDNGGKSPATETSVTLHVLPSSKTGNAKEFVEEFKFASLGKPSGQFPASVGEHDWNQTSMERIGNSPEDIPDADAQKFIASELPVYVYGVFQYRDIFGHQHANRYCFVQPIAVPKCDLRARPGGCFQACEFGNALEDLPN